MAPLRGGGESGMNDYQTLKKDLRGHADPDRKKVMSRFFKTGTGEYGEGDRFLGVTVPEQRALAKRYRDLPHRDIERLLASALHEERLVALLILIGQYGAGDAGRRDAVIALYLKNRARVNNWDLVDLSADKLLGRHLLGRDPGPLFKLARSRNLWERRMAILATLHFIRNGAYGTTLEIAEILVNDEHDLMHKAVGWMLREVGKRDLGAETRFLDRHARNMPRTMLRYAIEKFPDELRIRYLKK